MTQQPKILARTDLATLVANAKQSGKRVVFTNGVFDIIHPGHVRCLETAKSFGDLLIVGVNSDESVRRYKGPLRPIIPEMDRAELLAGLGCVDAVTIFSEATPIELLKIVQPHVHVKGGDYKSKEELSETKTVESFGGRVELVAVTSTTSTSAIIDTVLSRYRPPPVTDNRDALPERRPALFLDRDGTLIEYREFLSEPEHVKLLPGAPELIRKAIVGGYRIVVVTNQPGIGLGYFTKEDFFKTNSVMLRQLAEHGAWIDRIEYCPHNPGAQCTCHKPQPGLVLNAAAHLNIDVASSILVGDSFRDIELARTLGIASVLVTTGKTKRGDASDVLADTVVDSLSEMIPLLTVVPSSALNRRDTIALSSQTLTAMGQLAGKVSHDLNNLLGAARGMLEVVEDRAQHGEPPAPQHLALLRRCIEKVLDLSRRLQVLRDPRADEVDDIDIVAVARAVTDAVVTAETRVDVVYDVRSTGHVRASRPHLTHVLSALVARSVASVRLIPDPHLVIVIDEVIRDARTFVRLSIVDHGKGLSTAEREQLLTSVPVRTEDAALGFAYPLAFRLTRELGGWFEFSSKVDVGSVNRLFIPAA